ncbi:MAG: peptide chain release factor N(5)-glutamine methyltransferase [Chloroflexota bacterium]
MAATLDRAVAPATVGEALALADHRLRAVGLDSSEALVLVARVLDVSRASVLASPERPLSADETARFAAWLGRRERREPFAYILGEREFYGLDFQVDARVLVPRPESELIVELALDRVGALRWTGLERPVVVDVGTGSGALAWSVAVHAPTARVIASDVSAAALQVAARNRSALRVTRSGCLIQGDLLAWLGGRADIVMANLPYIPSAAIGGLMPDVREFEPWLALDGGPSGMSLIERLISQLPDHLCSGGVALLELDPPQVEPVRRLAGWAEVVVHRDLAGLDRVAELRRR